MVYCQNNYSDTPNFKPQMPVLDELFQMKIKFRCNITLRKNLAVINSKTLHNLLINDIFCKFIYLQYNQLQLALYHTGIFHQLHRFLGHYMWLQRHNKLLVEVKKKNNLMLNGWNSFITKIFRPLTNIQYVWIINSSQI